MRLILCIAVIAINNVFTTQRQPSLAWYLYSKQIREKKMAGLEPYEGTSTTTEPSTIISKGRKILVRPTEGISTNTEPSTIISKGRKKLVKPAEGISTNTEPSTIISKGRKMLAKPAEFRAKTRPPTLHVGQLIHKAPTRAYGKDVMMASRLKRKDMGRVVWRGWKRVSGDVRPAGKGRPLGRSEGRSGQMGLDPRDMTSLRALQRTTMATPLLDMVKKPVSVAVGTLQGEDQ